MDAITVQNLTKRYAGTLAVDDISFSLAQGGVLGLLGGNGAGKTTTISMLLGLLVPTSGRITVLGHDMAKDRFTALARMNFSSPYIALPSRLTVQENLRVYGHLYNVPKLSRRIAELAEQFNLGGLLKRPAGELSAGQKTRVALAKSFINKHSAAGRAYGQPGPGYRRLCADHAGKLPDHPESRDPAGVAQHGGGRAALRQCADDEGRQNCRSRDAGRYDRAVWAGQSGAGVSRYRAG
jgi:ABC-type transport system involved in cytochrome c biogenesis ATPase subunit